MKCRPTKSIARVAGAARWPAFILACEGAHHQSINRSVEAAKKSRNNLTASAAAVSTWPARNAPVFGASFGNAPCSTGEHATQYQAERAGVGANIESYQSCFAIGAECPARPGLWPAVATPIFRQYCARQPCIRRRAGNRLSCALFSSAEMAVRGEKIRIGAEKAAAATEIA